jgi:hypothetical protein
MPWFVIMSLVLLAPHWLVGRLSSATPPIMALTLPA